MVTICDLAWLLMKVNEIFYRTNDEYAPVITAYDKLQREGYVSWIYGCRPQTLTQAALTAPAPEIIGILVKLLKTAYKAIRRLRGSLYLSLQSQSP
jgi:hypothetical protein